MADTSSILRKRQREREQEREKRREDQEKRAREERDRQRASVVTGAGGGRRMTRPGEEDRPSRPITRQEVVNAKKAAGDANRQRQQDRQRASVVTGAGGGTRRFAAPEESEARRYRPPQQQQEEESDADRDSQRAGQLRRQLLNTWSRPTTPLPERRMYDVDANRGQVGLSTERVDRGPVGLFGTTPESDTTRLQWRPQLGPMQGPRTRGEQAREDEERPGIGPAFMARRPMEFGANLGNQLVGAGQRWANAQFNGPETPIMPMNVNQGQPQQRYRVGSDGLVSPATDTGPTPIGMSNMGGGFMNQFPAAGAAPTYPQTVTSRLPNTGADILASQGIDPTNPLTNLQKETYTSPLFPGADINRFKLAQFGVGQAQKEAAADRRAKGSNTGIDAAFDVAGDVFDAGFQFPTYRLGALPVPGTNHSIIQIGQAIGQAISKYAQESEPGNLTKLPFQWNNERTYPLQKEARAVNAFWEALNQSTQAWDYIEQLPPELRTPASSAFINMQSGGDNVLQTAQTIANKDQTIAQLEKQAQQAQAQWDESLGKLPGVFYKDMGAVAKALTAAEYGRQLRELKAKTNWDIVQENQEIGPALVEGIILDPTNIVGPIAGALGLTPEAWRAAKARKYLDRLAKYTPEEAAGYVQAVADNAKPLIDQLAGGTPLVDPKNWWQRVNPLARTPDTLAHLSADSLFKQAATMLSGVTDKDTAKAILKTWITDPAQLAGGIGEGDDLLRVGAATLENTPENRAILSQLADSIDNMASLQGSGLMNGPEVAGELDNLLYGAARRGYGLDKLDDLPVGTARTVAKKQGENGIVQYLDNKGRVIGSSDEMPWYEAQQLDKGYKAAAKSGGVALGKVANSIWGAQRAIMSDMWLNMRPGHWIRNALAATATTLADDLYTLDPTSKIQSELDAKGLNLAHIAGGETSGGRSLADVNNANQNWTRKAWKKFNPWAAASEAGSKIWSGETSIGGRVPFGESNFRLRAFYTAFNRFFDPNWTRTVAENFTPKLIEAGIDPAYADQLSSWIVNAGIRGNKMDVVDTARRLVNVNSMPISPQSLGLEPRTFSNQGWAEVYNVLNDGTLTQDQAWNALQEIGAREKNPYLALMGANPAQPGRTVNTVAEELADGADLIDQAVFLAKKSGQDPAVAEAEARKYVQGIIDGSRQQWETFLREAAADPDPEKFNVIVDAWKQVQELRNAARKKVDDLNRAAIEANNPQVWQQAQRGVRSIYDELPKSMQGVFDTARTDLANGNTSRVSSYWDLIDEYLNYDEIAIKQAREEGLQLGKAADDVGWQKAINANRQHVDKSFSELLGVLQQFPDQNSLDIAINAQRQVEAIGASAAGKVAVAREAAQKANTPQAWGQFRAFRNQTWYEHFDQMALTNNVAKYEVALQALAKDTASGLVWTDEFSGGAFQLVRPVGNNQWLAKNLEDGSMSTFTSATPNKAAIATAPQVPQNVLNDYYSLMGNQDKMVEQVVSSIPPIHGPVEEGQMGMRGVWRTAEGDQPVRIVRSTGQNVEGVQTYQVQLPNGETYDANIDELYAVSQGQLRHLPDIQTMMDARQTIDMADPKAIEQARLDMRREWDKKVKGVWGGMSLDGYVAKYYRDGTVIIPDKAKRIQDIYGTNVAGRAINNQDDLERFVLEYADLKRQADELKGAAGRAQGDYISAANRTEPYVVRSGEDAGQDARYIYDYTGNKPPQPTVGDAADFRRQEIEAGIKKIQDNLATIFKGTPNNLTPQQRLRAIDAAASLGATFDNVLSGAMEQGQQMADFAMLNFRDRRNADVWLSQVFPYHYFWTRSAKNWAQRIATRPAVANFYYEAQRAANAENEQNNIPEHLRGTIPNPVNALTGMGPARMTNPLDYAFPFTMYAGNEFVNPEEAKTNADYYFRLAQKYTPGLMPVLDYAIKKSRGELTDTTAGDYVPLYRIGGYANQAATGQVSDPNSFWGFGDRWDMGRIGKQIALNVISGDADPRLAKWALDQAYQIQENVGPLPEQPDAARAVWEAGAKEAGISRLWAVAGGYLLGLPFYELTPEEVKMRDMKGERYQLGYSADNPYGSRTAQKEFDKSTGGILDVAYDYSNLYPGHEDAVRPGMAVEYDDMIAERNAIYEERQKARDAYLAENPTATRKELEAATNEEAFDARLEALKEKYPNAATGGGNGGPPRGMNQTETAYWHLEQIIQNSQQGKPAKPENFESLSDEEKQAYYDAYALWAPTQLDAIENGVNGLLAADETEIPGIQNWRGELEKMAKGQYASELLRRYYLRFASDTERRWSDVDSLRGEMNDVQWAEREAMLAENFTPEQVKAWHDYMAIDKDAPGGKEARQALGKEHPYVYLMNNLAFSDGGYQKTTEKFGEGWTDTYLNYPQHPGKDATDAQKEAFYATEDKYIQQHPEANEVMLFVDGRWKPSGLPVEYKSNGTFGEDYYEAVRLFGEDIFEQDRNVPSGGGKAFGQYMEAHPKLWSYWEWRQELTDMTAEQYMAQFPLGADGEQQPLMPGEYTGPRPYGSDRQPIGLAGGPLNLPGEAAYPSNMGLSAEPLPTDQERASIVTGAGQGEVEAPLTKENVRGGPADRLNTATTPFTGEVDASGTPVSTTGRTAEDYLRTNESYQKYAAKRSEWKKNEALWAGRKQNVIDQFGEDAGTVWDEYYKLPKGDARKQYKADHPELKIYTIAAFNPDEYKQMGELFSTDDMLDWAYAPAWDGTEETDDLRRQYWAEHPTAFNVGAWINGRPKADNERDHDPLSEDWEYNFGADYQEAIDKFGKDIWSIVSQQKQLPDDKRARAQWYDAHPQYSEWADWWYGNMPDKQFGAYSGKRSGEGYDSLGHRAYGSWGGGGGGGGYGGGGGSSYVPRVDLPYIQPRYLNSSLWDTSGNVREWRPDWVNFRPDESIRGKGLKRTWA